MCLYLTKCKHQKIALRNIKCYKIIVHQPEGAVFSHYTPYQIMPINDEVINGSEQLRAHGTINVYKTHNSSLKIVKGGMIHTYKNYFDAVNTVQEMAQLDNLRSYEIYECIIPKFTRYYEGTNDCSKDNFASKKIIFKKLINTITYYTSRQLISIL